ncbi:hypothetical protein ACFQ6N_01195 [Kitasatospora sp. NPDC056446]|uniref:hypothetical protein n=1 Tax=Kitasatospora sp. NPDC056446 TaxID=3345819 RepID=UPI0036CE04C0
MVTHPSRDYAITVMNCVSDDAWHLELDLVREQRAVAIAVVPDEDPAREPTVCFDPQGRHLDIPYEAMRWFMDQVAEEIRTSRAWMRLRPELVEVVHRLRQEHLGAIDDADFPEVFAELTSAVPEADLPAVLAAAVGRNPDGATIDGMQAFRTIDARAVGRDHHPAAPAPAAPAPDVSGSC